MRKLKLVRDYNATAYLYDERYKEEQIVKMSFLLGILRPKENDILLDVGCGTGLLFEMLECRLMVGVDISINMLREAKRRIEKDPKLMERVELVLGDAEFLPIRSESMDVCVSVTALQLAGDQGVAVSEILRCLKEKGFFGISIIKKAKIPSDLPEGTEVYDVEGIKDVFCIGRKRSSSNGL